jgi:hypothetical protein
MNYKNLNNFINDGVLKWEKIKNDLSKVMDMHSFFEKSYLVLMLNSHQVVLDLAITLEPENSDSEKEIIRKQAVRYLKIRLKAVPNLKEVRIEVRFPSIKMDLIQKLKIHPMIKDLNWHSPASIKVVISYMEVLKTT